MDPLLVRFHRQYLQQISNPTYPPSKLLLEPDIQDQVYKHFFEGPLKGSATYQRTILKQIIVLIERAISDPENDKQAVSDALMEHMGYLSSLPVSDFTTEASSARIISYTLPVPFDAVTQPRILIEEAPNLLAAGSNVGLRTWEASLHLAQYLHSNQDIVKHKHVLELGAGTGLVSILCADFLEADSVLSTDGLLHVVEGIDKNIVRNRALSQFEHEKTQNLIARVLDWADLDGLDEKLTINGNIPSYGVILGADITYSPDVVPILAELLKVLVVDKFANTGLEAVISATVRNEHTLKVFRDSCEQQGLMVEEVDFVCPSAREQKGFFHEQAFPIIIMRIKKA